LLSGQKTRKNMLAPRALRETLERYGQLYVHLTVTGLGGTVLEPNIPCLENGATDEPGLMALVRGRSGSPWRFDPIVSCTAQETFSAILKCLTKLPAAWAEAGITTCRTSWVQPLPQGTAASGKKRREP